MKTTLLPRFTHFSLLIPVLCVLMVIMVVVSMMRLSETQLRRVASVDLAAERELISNSVDRLRHLPVAVAHHPQIIDSLTSSAPLDSATRHRLDDLSNRYLETVSNAAGASLLYIIDTEGKTRAANNWQDPDTLVGNNYRFRPYFQDAIVGAEARYYAVGVTTDEAGYYFAQPVRNQDRIVGVAVVKLELESLQRQWQKKKPHSLLVDEEGVVILSSNLRWRYRSTRILSQRKLDALNAQRKYADKALEVLDASGALADRRLRIDGQLYLNSTTRLPLQGWQMIQLTPISSVYNAGLVAGLVSSLLAGLGAALFLYQRERKRKNILSVAAQDAEKMRGMNQELQAQISERKKAEHHLKHAQAELIHASKLAALGQMSAAIAHEVNQPLSAIRTYSASAKLLLDRNRVSEAHRNLDEIQALTERLAILTYDLKTFARKSDVPRKLVSLKGCIDRVTSTLATDLHDRQIHLEVSVPASPVYVFGNSVRIEQVLSNLLRNAMDATVGSDEKGEVLLSVLHEDDYALIRVQDNGQGMNDRDIAHVFEPFFTTKPMGEGVGLGLSIAFGIVEEMNGQLRVRNSDEGGALFSVRLPYHAEIPR